MKVLNKKPIEPKEALNWGIVVAVAGSVAIFIWVLYEGVKTALEQ